MTHTSSILSLLRMPLLVSIILLYPVVCRLFGGGEEITFTDTLLSILVVLPITHLLCCIRNKTIFLTLLSLLFLISMIEAGMALISNNYVAAGNLISSFNTNGTESEGFLKANGWAIGCILPILVPFIAACRHWNIASVHLRYHLLLTLVTVLLSVSLIGSTQALLRKTPYNFVYQITRIISLQQAQKQIAQSDDFVFDATRDTLPAAQEIYVLAIGESLRYENFSLNGTYAHNTTPLLAADSAVRLMRNYYATAPITIFSVPQILTRGTANHFTRVYQEKTIAQAFTECGFKSFILAHQHNMLGTEAYLARGAERIIVTDDASIPPLVDSLAQRHNKLFIIAHFWGNHYPYIYPDDCNIFHPNERDTHLQLTAQHYINGYDNTTRYVDQLLHRIIQAINRPDTHSAFCFVSDHGELFTDKGALHSTTYNPPRNEYHVPLVVWNSAAWRSAHPDKQAALCMHEYAPLNADNIFYSLCDMADIHIPSDTAIMPQRSIFSTAWQPHPRYCMRSDGGTFIKLD